MADDERSLMGGSSSGGPEHRPWSKNSLSNSEVPRTNFREALKIHLADFQSRLIAEHESRLAPDLQSLELRIESLRAENERLRASMPEDHKEHREHSHCRREVSARASAISSSPVRKAPSERRSGRKTMVATSVKSRGRRSSVRGSSVFDLRPLRPFPEDEPEKKVSESSNHQNQDLVRAALAAWKEFTFNYVQDEDDESEQEIEALRQAAYKEWPEDLNGSEFWQAQLFRNELGRTMSSDLSASKEKLTASAPCHRFYRKHLVTSPSSRRRMIWDLCGLCLVIWDIFAIPMNAFELTDIVTPYIMSWVSTVFWTIDFPTNFFLGFYRAGHIVIDPWKIAWQYLRTWFAVDVGVLALDWFFIFLDITMADIEEDTDAAGNNYFRIARMSRGLKVLRILRLVRLAKLFPKFHSAFIVVQSDFIRLSMGAWFAVVIVVVMNHYVACVWFALGYWDTQAPITWVKENDLDGVQNPWKVELTYQYSTSLHWALCQFTPATTEVMATNTTERIFTVLTIILGLISFSSFVSNITTSMTQLRNLNSEKHKLQSALRTYFSQNEVPPEVSKCIYDWIHSHRKMHRVRVHEQDIELLAEMPERLRFKLREAVYRPVLCRHPFLQEWCEVDQRGFDRLCHQALQEIRISTEHTVFIKKEQAAGMYFVTGGELKYWKSALQDPMPIGTGDWICEIALWVQWRHCGTLSAKCASDVMLVDADLFRSVISGCSRVTKRMAKSYAAGFVRHDCEILHSNGWLGDVCCSFEGIQNLKDSVLRNASSPNLFAAPVDLSQEAEVVRESSEDTNREERDEWRSRSRSDSGLTPDRHRVWSDELQKHSL